MFCKINERHENVYKKKITIKRFFSVAKLVKKWYLYLCVCICEHTFHIHRAQWILVGLVDSMHQPRKMYRLHSHHNWSQTVEKYTHRQHTLYQRLDDEMNLMIQLIFLDKLHFRLRLQWILEYLEMLAIDCCCRCFGKKHNFI